MPQSATPQPMKLIMVVEDDADLAMSLADVLAAAGYSVAIAEHGRDAIDQLRAGVRPELILLDMMMPVLDGWGFRAEQVTIPEVAAIPVVALTAAGDVKRKAESIKAAGFLGKPVSIATLLAEVARIAGPPTTEGLLLKQ